MFGYGYGGFGGFGYFSYNWRSYFFAPPTLYRNTTHAPKTTDIGPLPKPAILNISRSMSRHRQRGWSGMNYRKQ